MLKRILLIVGLIVAYGIVGAIDYQAQQGAAIEARNRR